MIIRSTTRSIRILVFVSMFAALLSRTVFGQWAGNEQVIEWERMTQPTKAFDIGLAMDRSPVALSADGSVAAFCCANDLKEPVVHVFDTSSGALTTEIGHEGRESHSFVALSPSGRHLACVWRQDHQVRLFDSQTGKELGAAPLSRDGALSCMVVATSKLALGYSTGQIGIWNLQPLKHEVTLKDGDRAVTSLCIDRGEAHLAVIQDGRLRIWDVAAKESKVPADARQATFVSAAYDPSGTTLATLASSGRSEIHLWDMATGSLIRKTNAGTPYLSGGCGITFSRDGKYLLVVVGDDAVDVWNRDASVRIATFADTERRIAQAAVASDSDTLVSIGHYGGLARWRINGQRRTIPVESDGRNSDIRIAFSPDGTTLASGSPRSPSIKLWNASTCKRLAEAQNEQSHCNGLAFDATGKWLVSCDTNPRVTFWSMKEARFGEAKNLKIGQTATALASSSELSWIAIAEDEEVLLWDLRAQPGPKRYSLFKVDGKATSVAISPDNNRVAVTSTSKESLYLYDIRRRNLAEALVKDGDTLTCVAWSPNNAAIATGDYDGRVVLWDPTTAQPVHAVQTAENHVDLVRFSPDCRELAVILDDGSLELWDLSKIQRTITMRTSRSGNFVDLAYSNDGQWLAIGCSTGDLLIWERSRPIASPAELDAARVAAVQGTNTPAGSVVRDLPPDLEELIPKADDIRVIDQLESLGVQLSMNEGQVVGASIYKRMNQAVQLLPKLEQLKRLTLRLDDDAGTDMGFSPLSQLDRLEILEIRNPMTISDAAMAHLGGLESLRTLEITTEYPARINGAGMKPLAGLENLEELTLQGVWPRDPTNADRALVHIGRVRGLNRLVLPWNSIQGAALVHLKGLKNLKELDLTGNPVQDGLQHLRALGSLTTLNLSRTAITDEDLAELNGAAQLEVLSLQKTPITGRSLGALLEASRLRTIHAYGSKMGSATREALVGKYPNVEIQR